LSEVSRRSAGDKIATHFLRAGFVWVLSFRLVEIVSFKCPTSLEVEEQVPVAPFEL